MTIKDETKLRDIADKLSILQDKICELASQEEEVFESRSDAWQQSEKGEECQARMDLLNEIHENLDNVGAGLLQLLGEI